MSKDEALKMAIAEIEGWIDHAYGHTPEECADNKAIKACKEALAQPSNMVAVPADKLEKMQKELKRLRKKVQEVKDNETNRSWGVFG